MKILKQPFLIALCSGLVFCANAQEPSSPRLSGTWTGRERDGSEAGELSFQPKDRLIISFGGVTMAGRYEIDASKSPNLLVFHADAYPEKACASVEIKSPTEVAISHLCDGSPAALAKQSIITFTRK